MIRSIYGEEVRKKIKRNNLMYRQDIYVINRGCEDEEKHTYITGVCMDNKYPSGAYLVHETSCGYALASFYNGEYGYYNSKGELLPYRYDYATDFNKYGFAMVCLDGKVSWIDTNFNYLATDLTFHGHPNCTYRINNEKYTPFDGFDEVFSFSGNTNKLSKMVSISRGKNSVVYFDTEGNIKKFAKYNGSVNGIDSITHFKDGEDFSSFGTAMAFDMKDNPIFLFEKGYYILPDYMLEYLNQKGITSQINEDVMKLTRRDNNANRKY